MSEPLLLGVRQAAARLSIGRDTAYELVRSGRLRSVSVGRRRLVPVRELEAFVERETRGGDSMTQNGVGKDAAPDPIAAGPRA